MLASRSHARVHRENRKITFVLFFFLSGFIVLFDPPLSRGIFPTAVIYDDTRDSFHLDNRMRFEHLLSVSRRRVKLKKKSTECPKTYVHKIISR